MSGGAESDVQSIAFDDDLMRAFEEGDSEDLHVP
jgi:hypothetical protein